MKFLEKVAAEGGEVHVLENHVTAESEIMKEILAVPVAEVDEPHVVGEHVLEIISEQECEQVDDVDTGKDVTAAGNSQVFSEWQVEAGGDEILVDQRVGEKEEEDVIPVVDSKVEPVFTDPTETVSYNASPTFGSGNDSEGKMSEGDKCNEHVRAEVDSLTLENNTELMVAGDGNDVEKVDFVVTCLEVETAEKYSDADEEKVSPLTTKYIPTVEVKTVMGLITEVNPDVVDTEENVVHDLGDMKHTGVVPRDEFVEGKELTTMVEVENTGVEDEKDFKLDEHVIVVENSDVAIVFEDHVAGNSIIETVEELDSDMTRNDVADVHMEDANVKTEVAVDVVTAEIAREDTKFEAKMINSISTGDPREGMNGSAAVLDENNDKPIGEGEIRTQDTLMETETDMGESGKAFGGKRKRGKVSKSPLNPKHTGKASSRNTAEEDVCFICFDGGELVLCDRRGCPKAYHPTCVNRDEAFFRSKGRWNCATINW